jgi:hypothetical protein
MLVAAGLALVLATAKAAEMIDFECPEPDGLFPHPQQCDRYFECRNGHLTRKLCADGLVFDRSKSAHEDPCDHVQNTKHRCRGKPNLQRAKPGDANCPRQNGVYPSPDKAQCEKFYSCLKGVGSVQHCAAGLHFDTEIGTCVWARESKREGCLSANDRANKAQKKSSPKQRHQAQQSGNKPPDKPLANGFGCPGGKLGYHPTFPHPNSCQLS